MNLTFGGLNFSSQNDHLHFTFALVFGLSGQRIQWQITIVNSSIFHFKIHDRYIKTKTSINAGKAVNFEIAHLFIATY